MERALQGDRVVHDVTDASRSTVSLSFQVTYGRGRGYETFVLKKNAAGRWLMTGHTLRSLRSEGGKQPAIPPSVRVRPTDRSVADGQAVRYSLGTKHPMRSEQLAIAAAC